MKIRVTLLNRRRTGGMVEARFLVEQKPGFFERLIGKCAMCYEVEAIRAVKGDGWVRRYSYTSIPDQLHELMLQSVERADRHYGPTSDWVQMRRMPPR